ncbi:MAG: protein-L-isoaspartate(D-aspartate) O-methyltransferase [Methanoregula sp.]|uniref:protein-L-isoaspartate(D-aspartate) O-methyltransferase n=1 Tax=Methanoregula sp. TaxID=2052170 RepID=UPI0025E3C4F2|nr:protein-L-isoaspartate(D-aspartate) O-methyltransferase [Methanoregula sp.]MCK9631141.1 protein-L-isoaspartate(D-aspartate) O-methyltransferase [Methanoregula sp.]
MNTFPRADERSRMVEHQIRSRGITNSRVLTAMREIPRHLFIPPPYNTSAYEDAPLPIGNGQTISQPYIVALMTALIDPLPEDRVLEIGAGSGYQAAILSMLVQQVTTIERIPAVADLARENLVKIGLQNISIIVGDGTRGYPDHAPYDGIMITAATPEIPPPLIDQLTIGGILVAPVGGREIQELITLTRNENGVVRSSHGGVRFVPLIGEHGWADS